MGETKLFKLKYQIKALTSVLLFIYFFDKCPFKIFRRGESKNASPCPAPQDPQRSVLNVDEDEFETGGDLGPGTICSSARKASAQLSSVQWLSRVRLPATP